MLLVRPAVAVGLGAALVLAGTAGAAAKPKVKPVCNLITDVAGDATGFLVLASSPAPSDKDLDVLSGDIASDGKTVTAVIRTAALGTDSTSPTGDAYYLNFSVDGTTYYVEALVTGSSATYEVGDQSGAGGTRHGLGAATGFLDAGKKAIHISVPASMVKAGPKSVFGDFDVLAQRYIDLVAVGITPTADEATSKATYKAGTPSCVVPGK